MISLSAVVENILSKGIVVWVAFNLVLRVTRKLGEQFKQSEFNSFQDNGGSSLTAFVKLGTVCLF